MGWLFFVDLGVGAYVNEIGCIVVNVVNNSNISRY